MAARLAALGLAALVIPTLASGPRFRPVGVVMPRETAAVVLGDSGGTAGAVGAVGANGRLAQLPARAAAPAPTPAPVSPYDRRGRLLVRDEDDRTCGFVSGDASSALVCASTAQCVYNATEDVVGCCPATDLGCALYTACLAYTESASFDSLSTHTMYCSNMARPACVTYIYADNTPYSIIDCGTIAADVTIFYTTNSTSSTSSTSTSRSTTTSRATTSRRSTTTRTSSGSKASRTSKASKSKKKKGSTDAVVGGVVGGLALVAIIALAGFLINRRRQKSKSSDAPSAGAAADGDASDGPAPDGKGNDPASGQHDYQQTYHAAPPGAPAAYGQPEMAAVGAAATYGPSQPVSPGSVAASPHSPNSAVPHYSSYGTPSMAEVAGTPSPAPAYEVADTPTAHPDPVKLSQAPAPAPGMGFQSGPVPAYEARAELPMERGHGEVRELA